MTTVVLLVGQIVVDVTSPPFIGVALPGKRSELGWSQIGQSLLEEDSFIER